MPLVQRVELYAPEPPEAEGADKPKKKAAPKVLGHADIHTKLSGGQTRAIVRSYNKHIAAADPIDRDQIAWQWDVILMLTEGWDWEDPDKPGEALPKSFEGLERADQAQILALWAKLSELADTAFPNV